MYTYRSTSHRTRLRTRLPFKNYCFLCPIDLELMALLYSALVLGTTTTKASTSIVKHKLPVLVYNVLKEVLGGVIFVKLIAIMVEFSIQKTHLVYYLTYKVDHLYELVVVVLGITALYLFATCRICDHGPWSTANTILCAIEHQRNSFLSGLFFKYRILGRRFIGT